MKMKFVLSLMVVAAQIAAAGVVAGEGEVQVVSVAEAATLTESGPVMLYCSEVHFFAQPYSFLIA